MASPGEETTSSKESSGLGASLTEQIVRGLTSGVIAVDAQDRIVTVNPAASRHLNIDLSKIESGQYFESIDELRPFLDILNELRDTLLPLSRREVYIGNRESGKKEIGVSVSLLEGPEDYNGAIFLFTDMTERRRLERAASANAQLAALGELAAGVVHELRNPLAIISGRAELLLRKIGDDDSSRDSVEAILSEVGSLTKSIAQFLGFAKPFELIPEACTPGDVLSRAVDLCEEHAREEGVELVAEVDDNLDEMFVDKARNAEVLANIIDNAIDAVDEGGRVRAHTYQESMETVFIIEDDGPGIHLQPGEDLFSPFFTKRRDGTGLGLAIVNRIVRAQGGAVTYSNQEAGGTRFEVRMPTVHGRPI